MKETFQKLKCGVVINGFDGEVYVPLSKLCQAERYVPSASNALLSVDAETEDYPQVEAEQWVKPTMEGYRMMCCDCSLIHEIDFRVVRVVEILDDGSKVLEEAGGEYEVELRARRIDR